MDASPTRGDAGTLGVPNPSPEPTITDATDPTEADVAADPTRPAATSEVTEADVAAADDAFRRGQEITEGFERVVREQVIPLVEESVSRGEDPSPILRGVAKALRTVADGIDPDAPR
ncbi:hypothetical protein FTX61_18905 [Nitriliruptoraceae bacterium ZYF776]|nr:hypothetical protein [Profundirhabdus halotolerans]